MSNTRLPKDSSIAALLGMAFDSDDGPKRITRGENFLLLGGSEDSHVLMRDTVMKINKRLDAQRRQLADVSVDELRDIIHDVQSDLD